MPLLVGGKIAMGKKEKIDVGKRELFKLFGKTSVALGSLAAIQSCVRKPEPQKLIPYLNTPEKIIPGIPYWFATTCSGCPACCGILVKTEDGIPRKVEGNPQNPISAGKTCVRGQAILHQLYSPDRIKKPLVNVGGKFSEISLEDAISKLVDKLSQTDPKEVYLITSNITGRTEKFYQDFAQKLGIPDENILRWETVSFNHIKVACEKVFSKGAIPIFRLDKSDFIVSFSADFLDVGPSTVLYSRWFVKSHAVDEVEGEAKKGAFVHISPHLNLTGANADKWIRVKAGSEIFVAAYLLNKIIDKLGRFEDLKVDIEGDLQSLAGVDQNEIDRLADFVLTSHSPLFIPPSTGDENLTNLTIIVMLLNYVVGSVDKLVIFEPSFSYEKLATIDDILKFVRKIRDGKVKVLLIINSYDPVYSIPRSTGFQSALGQVPFVVSFTYHENETIRYSHLVIPDYHALEKWGDSEIIKGIISFYQPVVAPLYKDAMQVEDLLIQVANKLKEGAYPYKSFLEYLKAEYSLPDEEWLSALEKGGIFSFNLDELEGKPISLNPQLQIRDIVKFKNKVQDSISLVIYPSYKNYEGRMANSPWIQEFFDPVTRCAWGNVLEVSKDVAEKLGFKNADIAEVEIDGRKFEIPVFVYYGLAYNTVALALGGGHENYGRFATSKGVNPLRYIPMKIDDKSGEISFTVENIRILKTGRRIRRLTTNEGVPRQLKRDIAHFTLLSQLPMQSFEKKYKDFEKILKKRFPRGDWEKFNRDSGKPNPYRWKMVIDLDKCIGCGACIVACQVENNIPFVGEEEIYRGREITWIRVERYLFSEDEILKAKSIHNHKEHNKEHNNVENNSAGEVDAKFLDKVVFVPMMCQHCEYAPCEYVCPVYATVHSSDGLNIQVYNRCVGTRFCANNCPYKVRYFNFYDYYKNVPEPLNYVLNPDVTFRSKGVMEKCSFCVQRINFALQNAKIEKRGVRDGEVIPACAQVCPADAIIFGNGKDENSQVSKTSRSKRADWALKELGAEPSVTYLEKVFNSKLFVSRGGGKDGNG